MKDKVKLSELPPETLLSYEDAHEVLTAKELIEKLQDGDVPLLYNHHDWRVSTLQRWRPDAEGMLEQYLENEYDSMYEGWLERAQDCLKEEHYARIQAVLDEAFGEDYATKFWLLDGSQVKIDISKKKVESDGNPHV